MEQDNGVKILFKFYSDLLDQDVRETLWGGPDEKESGHYYLESIPFYIPFVATNDLVAAEYDDEENMLVYRETITPSGNSTVWVVITDDETDIGEVMDLMKEQGCESEAASDRFFAMEVLAEVNYLKVRDKLNELRSDGLIDFMEPYLSTNHQY